MACEAWARQAIVKAVDEEWISEKHDEDIGYQAVKPIELLELLRSAGGDLDDLEITELNTKMLEPWDGVEAPVTMFARADKYERQLERHIIPQQPELRLSYAVATYQTSGQFDAAMREWHARPSTNKSFPKFRVYIQKEYTKQVKQNRSTAGSVKKGIANAATEEEIIEAQAMMIAEVANAIHEKYEDKMKTMMTNFEKLQEKLLASVKPTAEAKTKQPRKPRQQLTECPNCKKKHANHDKCWELEANKELRPANWKSVQNA
jgi:hypothetical protein